MVAEITPTEKVLIDMLTKYVEIETEKNSSSSIIHQNFTEMGLDSIVFIKLKSFIKTKYAIKLKIQEVLENPTISQLASLIDSKKKMQ